MPSSSNVKLSRAVLQKTNGKSCQDLLHTLVNETMQFASVALLFCFVLQVCGHLSLTAARLKRRIVKLLGQCLTRFKVAT